MDRRSFLTKVTAAGAAGAASVNAAPVPLSKAHETRAVTWKVKGFTCITCSVGLEVMMKGLNGVTRVSASYPANQVIIGYDERLTNEKTLRDFVSVCGFEVRG